MERVEMLANQATAFSLKDATVCCIATAGTLQAARRDSIFVFVKTFFYQNLGCLGLEFCRIYEIRCASGRTPPLTEV